MYLGKKSLTLLATSLGFFMLLNSCKHEIPLPIPLVPVTPVDTGTITSGTCSPDSVYFNSVIFPLITSTCAMSGCHDAISHREGVNLTSYSLILNYVNKGNAGSSRLYKVIVGNGDNPMPPGAPWTSAQLSKLQTWINQGANNNTCNACDTTNFKYSTAIQPLIQNSCQGCHNPASLGGGIDLSTYAGVKASAATGKLYGSISWTTGYFAMPLGGVKMSSCQIAQVKKWIDAGSLNN